MSKISSNTSKPKSLKQRHRFFLNSYKDCAFTNNTGNSVWKPMWLIVIGDQREQISATVAYQSFRQRFDIEHMFRFSKQHLLMTEFQTPDVKHEENWIRLVMLAYA